VTESSEAREARFAKLAKEARLEYEQRIADKRAATGCYREDGLYQMDIYKMGFFVLCLDFVDDSSITVTHNGMIGWSANVENWGGTPRNMAEKWLNNGGREWIAEKYSELREEVKIIDLRTLKGFHSFIADKEGTHGSMRFEDGSTIECTFDKTSEEISLPNHPSSGMAGQTLRKCNRAILERTFIVLLQARTPVGGDIEKTRKSMFKSIYGED